MGTTPWGWELWEKYRQELLTLAVERPCPTCGSGSKMKYFSSQCGYQYVNCLSCGMVYVDKAIPAHAWSQIYITYPEFESYMRTWTLRPLSEHTECDPANLERFRFYFEKLIKKCDFIGLAGMKYLDIGTFDGDALVIAREHYGMNPHGIEAREDIADLISELRGLKITGLVSDDMDPNVFGGEFHLVSAFESLEHSYDPQKSLCRIYDSLTEGGVVIVTVPNIDNMEIQHLREYSPHVSGGTIGPGHINLFGKKTLGELFSNAGFEIVDVFSQYASSIDNILYKENGLEKHIPSYQSIISGEFEENGPQLFDRGKWGSFLTVLYEWETAQLQGPILGMIGRKPGTLPVRPETLHTGQFFSSLPGIDPSDVEWTTTNITMENGTIIHSGPVTESAAYAILMKPVKLTEDTTHERSFQISGISMQGGISVGLQRDGAWVVQHTVAANSTFKINLPIDRPGNYQVVVSHNLPTRFLDPDGRPESSEWRVDGYDLVVSE